MFAISKVADVQVSIGVYSQYFFFFITYKPTQ